ncbi:hypothetical protein LPN04_05550 [Rugamonas sp. A1-17]|nr:hypothetical protein [Rugamonas sp. A1-17]
MIQIAAFRDRAAQYRAGRIRICRSSNTNFKTPNFKTHVRSQIFPLAKMKRFAVVPRAFFSA